MRIASETGGNAGTLQTPSWRRESETCSHSHLLVTAAGPKPPGTSGTAILVQSDTPAHAEGEEGKICNKYHH